MVSSIRLNLFRQPVIRLILLRCKKHVCFAKLLDYHWELSKKVDAGSSNTLIEQIFSSIEEMIDGRLVCGAGGGGFLQVILKKGITREDVEKRLNEVFMDSLVGVADCKLVW